MKYTIKDLIQASIGSFLAVVIFFAIRGDNPFFFNETSGMIISVIIIYIYYNGFNDMKNRNLHFMINVLVALIICSIVGVVFGLITQEQLFTTKIFGSLIAIGWWVAIPLALLFDKFNFTNPLRRYYIRNVGK